MLVSPILFLATTISSASIVLADIFVPSGYEHQYGSSQHNPYHQPVLQYNRMPFPAERHHAEQLTPQQVTQHRAASYMYPYYGMYPNPAPSNLMRFPISHQFHSTLPKPASHLQHVKVKDHGHVRPLFVSYPLTVHRQYRRSCKSDSTRTESSDSATTKHEADVATEPSLIDVKHSTVNDSLLPENEPADTDEKRVKNRQSKNDHAITGSFLFGLNPERMYPRYRQVESLDATKQSVFKSVPVTPNTPSILDEESAMHFVQSIESTHQLLSTPQKREHNQQNPYIDQEDHRIRNVFSKDLENLSVPTQTSSDEDSSEEELLSATVGSDESIIKIPCANCNRTSSFLVEFDIASLDRPVFSKSDEILSESEEIIHSPNSDIVVPFAPQTFYVLSNNDIAPFVTYYDYDYHRDYNYPCLTTPVINKNTYLRDNLASMDTMMLDVSRMQQFTDTYNYPTKTRYLPLPNDRKYYYVTPDASYSHIPFYRKFSSPAYY